MVGYSRLMGQDETWTRSRFNAHLQDLIEPTIESHQGRIVKTTGDGLLFEFGSFVESVQCAVEIENGMTQRNADESNDRWIEFRIGVNLGNVIIEGDDIHGDGIKDDVALICTAETSRANQAPKSINSPSWKKITVSWNSTP